MLFLSIVAATLGAVVVLCIIINKRTQHNLVELRLANEKLQRNLVELQLANEKLSKSLEESVASSTESSYPILDHLLGRLRTHSDRLNDIAYETTDTKVLELVIEEANYVSSYCRQLEKVQEVGPFLSVFLFFETLVNW